MKFPSISLRPGCPTIILNGFLNDQVAWVVDETVYRHRKRLLNENLIVLLNSVGGRFTAFKSILETLDDVKANGPGVVTYGFGTVWSATTVLMAAGDWRLLSPKATYGLHSTVYRGELTEEEKKLGIESGNVELAELYDHFSQGAFSPDKSAPWLSSETMKFMPPEEVLANNLCDAIGNIEWLDEGLTFDDEPTP